MNQLKEKLEEYLAEWAASGRFSGTALIAQGERCLLNKGYGLASHEHHVPNTSETVYCIGSITKLFTAAAVLQLVERGRLGLDDPIGAYWKDYRHAEEITVHQLLSSSSGIPDYTELPEYNTRDRISVEQIAGWLNSRPLEFAPGQRVQKSNTNFVFLARMVELVTGMDIEAYYDANLLKSIGLGRTGVYRNGDVIPHKALGYSCSGEGVVQAEYYDMSGAFGSGFMYATAEDLFRWIRALKTDGLVISGDSLKRMVTPYGYLRYLGVSVGYGCSLRGEPIEEVCADGNIHGYTCTVRSLLQGDYTVILLCNNDAVPIGRIAQGITSILAHGERGHSFTITPRLLEGTDYEPYALLAGEYTFRQTGWRFTVSFDNGALFVDRLFIQEAKREKFRLKLVLEDTERVIMACEACDSTFSFLKDGSRIPRKVLYSWDTLELPYER